MENLGEITSQNYLLENTYETVSTHPIALGITNGLITTSIIWAFWCVFIILFAVPLASNQLKQAVCSGASFLSSDINVYKNQLIMYLVSTFGLSWEQATSFVNSMFPSNATAAKNIIQSDPDKLKSVNKNLTTLYIIISVLVILASLLMASFMIYIYKLDAYRIVLFNIIMLFIIVGIEIGFFSSITMAYMAYDPLRITQELIDKINSYVKSVAT